MKRKLENNNNNNDLNNKKIKIENDSNLSQNNNNSTSIIKKEDVEIDEAKISMRNKLKERFDKLKKNFRLVFIFIL